MTAQTPHPLIAELFNTLPAPGEEFAVDKRADFLVAATAIFGLLYVLAEDEPHHIIIQCRPVETAKV